MVNLSSFETEYFCKENYGGQKGVFCFDKNNLVGGGGDKMFNSHFPFQFHTWEKKKLKKKKRGVYLTFNKYLACEKSPIQTSIRIPIQAHIAEASMCLFSHYCYRLFQVTKREARFKLHCLKC